MMALENRKKAFICFTAGLAALIAYRYRRNLAESWKKLKHPLGHRRILLVENVVECQAAVGLLKEHTSKYSVLGFDVEWVTVSGERKPCALLQLSSHKGLCALFRLCSLKQVPLSLRQLLEDDEIVKVGVGPQDDAQKLSSDYGVGVASTFDLRFLASMTGHKPEGLAKLSKSILDVQLDKHWRIACSNWEAIELTEAQKNYAANDALVAIEIFRKLARELEPRERWSSFMGRLPKVHFQRLEPFFDIHFKEGSMTKLATTKVSENASSKVPSTEVNNKKTISNGEVQVRGICTRSKTMYDNCLLEAPDGELLCTIDRKKAQWYIDQNLGKQIKNPNNFTVRLNFEPAGRAVGEVGRYYQEPKENRCVVCGREDIYIRKNVVPREYRKHFPVVMKSHTSHDILPLCPTCHQLSNISDIKIRRRLAELCDAPLSNESYAVKFIEIPELKKVRSSARALLRFEKQLPPLRRNELQNKVREHFKTQGELSKDILIEAANLDPTGINAEYCEHGKKVVDCFQSKFGGLIELEKMWREHFLITMQPQYMPRLWSVNHNANRLEIRAQEGRVAKHDLILAGLDVDSNRDSKA